MPRHCSTVYTKRPYLVDNLECHFGPYKWCKYSQIPLDWLKQELYSGRYSKKENTRNIRITKYILERIEKEKEKELNKESIGFISFD
tara:strand:- start:1021 stop:1281 length:261 start_codon:yes stop_codon:yes gene_type:complete